MFKQILFARPTPSRYLILAMHAQVALVQRGARFCLVLRDTEKDTSFASSFARYVLRRRLNAHSDLHVRRTLFGLSDVCSVLTMTVGARAFAGVVTKAMIRTVHFSTVM